MSEPLVWTTKGNLPISTLQHRVDWSVTPEQIIFTESYFLGDELVKKSSHVKVLTGVAVLGEAET